jgi:UDP-N-acetylmuramoyl-tripeptide--D-alanyl-D-alanine ligase
MANALEILRSVGGDSGRRRVFVCGDMGELGDHAQGFHSDLGTQIGRAGVQVLVAVGQWASVVAAQARQVNGCLQAVCFVDAFCACQGLSDIVKENDIVLVKGSRSVRLEQAIDTLRALFGQDRGDGSWRTKGPGRSPRCADVSERNR